MDLRMVAAETPDRGRMYYLIDDDLNFIPEVKDFLNTKAAQQRAPATIEGYCYRLLWYFRFLEQHHLNVLRVKPADLTEFVIWLCNPHRNLGNVDIIHQPSPVSARTVNLIIQAVGSLYRHLVRQGVLEDSPVRYIDVPRSKWLRERDLLAHTRRGKAAHLVPRSEIKLREPKRLPATIDPEGFKAFLESIHMGRQPGADPCGFRDRLICLALKEGGFRVGELMGVQVDDLEFGKGGVHVRFRCDNPNGARAKAGYGRDRFVHLPADVLGLLDIYLTEIWAEVAPSHAYLWLVLRRARSRSGSAAFGSPLAVGAVEKMFAYYSARSGVRLHPHMLRHTHATELVRSFLREDKPVDWKFIQERLGHASVVTTMETYVHLVTEDHRAAYNAYLQRRQQASEQRRQAQH